MVQGHLTKGTATGSAETNLKQGSRERKHQAILPWFKSSRKQERASFKPGLSYLGNLVEFNRFASDGFHEDI